MKVILLAAGFGTRLKPLTDKIPKCLVQIKGKPILQIWLDKLSNTDIKHFLINTHYLSDQVNYFVNNSIHKEKCIIKYEEKLLGTAGTLIANLDYINNDECLLIHADNYCQDNINNFIIAHKQRPPECLMTMLTFRTNNPSSCGIIEVDHNNVVVGFYEKKENPPGNLANGAVYILSSELIKILKYEYKDATDFSNEIIPNLINKIYTYETKDIFIDIGTLEAYNKANNI